MGIKRLNVAGRHVTRQLIALLQLRGYSLNRSADFDTARQIKERLCYVGYDLAVERRLAMETTTLVQPFQLPDGRIIKVGRERFEASEVLFDPDKAGVEGDGLHKLLCGSVLADIMKEQQEFWLSKEDYEEKGAVRAIKEHHGIGQKVEVSLLLFVILNRRLVLIVFVSAESKLR